MKVKARQRGARDSAGQSQHAAQPGQKHSEQLSQDLSLPSGRGDGSASNNASASGSSTAASGHTLKGSAAAATHGSASSVVAAAASRPPLLIGTTSAAARPTPPSRALTQQQLRRQRQQHRAHLPPVRVRGGGRQAGCGAPGAASAATFPAGGGGARHTTTSSPTSPSTALDEAVKAVEGALEDGPLGQQRLQAMSLEQPDLYSQVILALFRKTQSLELISRMPMPLMPEPDFLLDPPSHPPPSMMPGGGVDYEDLDLAWDEGEEGEELDRWEAMMAAAAGGYGGMYDLDGGGKPFPVEPPFPDFDYDPEFDDGDYDGVYEEAYGDEDEDYEDEDGEYEDFGYLGGKAGTILEQTLGGLFPAGADGHVEEGEEAGEPEAKQSRGQRQEYEEYGKYNDYDGGLGPELWIAATPALMNAGTATHTEEDCREQSLPPYTTAAAAVRVDADLGADPLYDSEKGVVDELQSLRVTASQPLRSSAVS